MARLAFCQLGRFDTRRGSIVSGFIWIDSDASDHPCEQDPTESPIGGSTHDLEVRPHLGEVQVAHWGE